MAQDREVQAFSVRLPKDEHDALRVFAGVAGMSMNDVVVRAVREFLTGDGRREQFKQMLADARTQYRTTLDKLADL